VVALGTPADPNEQLGMFDLPEPAPEPAPVDRGEAVISLHDVGIRFSRNRRKKRSLRDLLYKGRSTVEASYNEFWPFRHVSFDIHSGEAVGVVGRNGAGKSTLLSLIAGVLIPDEGTVEVRQGVAPLIAITGGFEPELTARENIGFVAGLHGMSDAEIVDAFDEIVEFAEVREFLDTPYKHFSSGMKVRLAFSVVSRLREPILLVDEVLAVGDAAFAKKCYARITSLLEGGQTLFLVSHAPSNLKRFCERGLYLADGELRADGPIGDVLLQYQQDTDTVDTVGSNDVDVDADPQAQAVQPDVGTVG
jgi:ABC-2 type transport system ATP-binding protein